MANFPQGIVLEKQGAYISHPQFFWVPKWDQEEEKGVKEDGSPRWDR